jgi:hypothetical protein
MSDYLKYTLLIGLILPFSFQSKTFAEDNPTTTNTVRLSNLSTRAFIQGGAADIIAGFIISGTGTQKVVIRGWGLETGIDPTLTIQKFPNGELVASNDNWQNQTSPCLEIPSQMALTYLTDAGCLLDLPAGGYTAILSSVDKKGLGLIAVDELEKSSGTTELTNLSTRASIEGEAGDIIAGLIISGTGMQKVVIKGWGLEAGVDPTLTIQKFPSGEWLASNDNWQNQTDPCLEIPSQMALINSTDSGCLLDLPVGAYTATLGSNGTRELGLVGVNAIFSVERDKSDSSLPLLEKASSIKIQDEWIGLSPYIPLEAHYTLHRKNNQFSGIAAFSVCKLIGLLRESVEDITIPLEVVQKFLKMLTSFPREEGNYKPKMIHSDDYPSIKITLETDRGTVLFFTRSQGAGHVPWGVTFDRTTYIINSDIPAKAIEILKPYLKKDERLESLSNECLNSAR